MNLAYRDVRHNLFRFLLTCFGLSLLLSVVLAMIGIYRGIVVDALTVARNHRVDLWVVEAGSRGPFAEASRIPGDSREAIARLAGVTDAGSVTYQIGRSRASRPQDQALRDRLRAGTPGRTRAHCRRADDCAKPFRDGRRPRAPDLALGDRIKLGRTTFTSSASPKTRLPRAATPSPSSRCSMPRSFSSTLPRLRPVSRPRGEPQARARTRSMRWWRGSPQRPIQRPLPRRRDVGSTLPP